MVPYDRCRLLISSYPGLMDHSNFDALHPRSILNLNRHLDFLLVLSFCFYFFAAARSLALRARGLEAISVWPATTGFLVSKISSASRVLPARCAKNCLTSRSSKL